MAISCGPCGTYKETGRAGSHRVVYTDGVDNDGDGLVDCADPECNGATPGGTLDPWGPDSTPQVCHPNTCPATLHEDLEGFWQFEDNADDSSGEGNDASLQGGASYTSEINGRLGRSVSLDGSADYVEIPDDDSYYATLDPEEALTLSAYVYVEDESSQRGIIGEGLSAPYQLLVDNGGFQVNLDTSSASPTEDFGNVDESEWQHVAVTYDSDTGSLKGYVDGSEVLDASTSGEITNSSDDVYIGSLQGTTGYFDGRIDQPRIYNRSLSAAEVKSFTDDKCNNRQRTLECVESPELCNTTYNAVDGYHCSYGKYDDPQNTDYSDPAKDGTGICCPRDQEAAWDDFNDVWTCDPTNSCGVGPTEDCTAAITSNQSKWLADKANGTPPSSACNSQVPTLHEDTTETTSPEGSQACCYVPKNGVTDYWYKDGNVKIYG